MATGFFAILDDISVLMDDVAVASKIATRKTAGILGDDLAVNAEKATGFVSSRELPVLWAISKGSLINKVIIIPIAILLNIYFPAAIKYILIFGGIYLAFEGVEKIYEFFFHKQHEEKKKVEADPILNEEDLVAAEKTKIKSAIITDFILSIEIVIIALSTVIDANLTIQILTVAVVSLLATFGVYGIVALIVRLDDVGYRFINYSKKKGFLFKLGNMMVNALPWIIKSFSVIGTIALILVSGGIFVHQIEYFHHLLPHLYPLVKEALAGLVIGAVALLIFEIGKKVYSWV